MSGNLSMFFAVAGAFALIAAVLAFWQSLRALFAMRIEAATLDAGGEDDRAALLAEKQAVLRGIKDLEFERAVGKITDEDFTILDTRYRAKARELLRELDQDVEPFRARARELVRDAIAGSGALGVSAGEASPAVPASDRGLAAVSGHSSVGCASCGTSNDVDAQFCKRCGVSLAEVAAKQAGVIAEPATAKDGQK